MAEVACYPLSIHADSDKFAVEILNKLYKWTHKYLSSINWLSDEMTGAFEWTAPSNKIVMIYYKTVYTRLNDAHRNNDQWSCMVVGGDGGKIATVWNMYLSLHNEVNYFREEGGGAKDSDCARSFGHSLIQHDNA